MKDLRIKLWNLQYTKPSPVLKLLRAKIFKTFNIKNLWVINYCSILEWLHSSTLFMQSLKKKINVSNLVKYSNK